MSPAAPAPIDKSGQEPPTVQLFKHHSAIIIPRSVANITPDDLIAHILPLPAGHPPNHRFAVFFLTPEFATWLLDDQTFLQKALRQVYRLQNAEHEIAKHREFLKIHALCAVVGKLPAPSPFTANAVQLPGLAQLASNRSLAPPVWELGYAGMAYTVLRLTDSVPWSSSPVGDASSSTEGEGTVNFMGRQHSPHGGVSSAILRLPLASTVFQTGQPTTMTFSAWQREYGAEEFTLQSKENVMQHGIKFQKVHNQSAHSTSHMKHVSTLAIPLIPLTLPRRVVGSMGNIIRRVQASNDESVPASQELEAVVPQYFKSRGESSQTTPVWALVIPQAALQSVVDHTRVILGRAQNATSSGSEIGDWEALWRSEVPLWNNLVPMAISKGARLYRVLSGGGGWGKKAGLLSLDPGLGSDQPFPVQDDDIDSSEGTQDLSSALQQVVHNGDCIQFFICPPMTKTRADDPNADLELLKARSDMAETWGWEIGTIPSTADSLSSDTWQHSGTEEKDISVFRNCFGALSEGGLTIERRVHLRPQDPSSFAGSTKIDVPFSRVSAADVVIGGNELSKSEGPTAEDGTMQITLPSQTSRSDGWLISQIYTDPAAPSLLGLPRRGLEQSDREKPELETQEGTAVEENVLDSSTSSLDDSPNLRLELSSGARHRHVPSSRMPIRKVSSDHVPVHKLEDAFPLDPPRGETSGASPIRRVLANTNSQSLDIPEDRSSKNIRIIKIPFEADLKPLPDALGDSRVRTFLSDSTWPAPSRLTPLIRYMQRQRNKTQVVVEALTNEYRKLMHSIRQRLRTTTHISRPRPEVTLNRLEYLTRNIEHSVHISRTKTTSTVLDALASHADRSDARLYATQKDVHTILDSMKARVFIRLDNHVNAIITTVLTLRGALAHTVAFIATRAQLTHAANTSAVTVYTLHTALRSRIGAMLLARAQPSHPHPHPHIFPHALTTLLLRLRAFNTNLFADQPRTQNSIRHRLAALERRNARLHGSPTITLSLDMETGLERTGVMGMMGFSGDDEGGDQHLRRLRLLPLPLLLAPQE
ncbi:hypothetical protein BDV95DRAFT_623801 [Massariosphaeria phaeospora]|uniref:Uncharacterized protein n=1 Tax=Massariosphaeria phaeospora TaxID=100035 RepID=A0A7C8M1S3_9PLEO|nr:hypothetical protein BDV95DRAFT_623801 [Massariosphaeria phaeospora]